jgi:PKD domain
VYCPDTLEYSTTYYWRIVAWDPSNASTAGPVWHFTTMPSSNQPPNTPENPFPPNGTFNVDVQTELRWDGGDPDPEDTVTYDVYFDSENPPGIIIHNQSVPWCTPGTLEYSTRYYWRIVAWDTSNASTTGPLWQFTTMTQENQPPEPPEISGPHYGKVNALYDFSLGEIIDPDGDQLYGFWDWGDGTEDWLGPYESGQPGNASHSWSEPGNYTIHVKMRDINGAMSNWSTFWIEIVQQRTAVYIGTFTSMNQTDDLFILQGRTFLVFPSHPFIMKEGIIVLSKENRGYLGATIAFGVGGITVL